MFGDGQLLALVSYLRDVSMLLMFDLKMKKKIGNKIYHQSIEMYFFDFYLDAIMVL